MEILQDSSFQYLPLVLHTIISDPNQVHSGLVYDIIKTRNIPNHSILISLKWTEWRKSRERRNTMRTREQIFDEIKALFGLVPSFMKTIPDTTLENEWELFKKIQVEPGAIPNKYRELIGLGLSAVSKCRYCTLFHTEMAKLFGATDKEIEEAVHYAKSSAGWSAYLNGMQVDYEQFKDELRRSGEYARTLKKAA
jgi:AhpD family alkylhydroperoxidase